MEPHRTAFTADGLSLRGLPLDLYAGEVHYWRLQPEDWPRCLRAVRALGFAIITTPAPWSEHEVAPGRFDFRGARDLGRFLDEAAAAGLHAIVRPGPYVGGELTGLGYPARIAASPAMRAVSARGAPMWSPLPPRLTPLPSSSSAAFRAAARGWLDAVGEVVAPRRFPDGSVVAVAVDGGGAGGLRLGAFDGDYHPDALAAWQAQRDEPPPRAWHAERPGLGAEWVRFKEERATDALADLAGHMERDGFAGLARFHVGPPVDPWHAGLPGRAAAVGGPCGLSIELPPGASARARTRALYLAGSATLPLAQVRLGGPAWLPPVSDAEQASAILGVLAAGARALSFAMVVDRERWTGAPIDVEGDARPPAPFVAALLAALRRLDWPRLRRRAPVALIASRADARFADASSLVDPLSPVATDVLDLGPAGAAELGRDPDAIATRRWFAALEAALVAAQVPYVVVDEAAPLDGYRAVVVPTVGRVDRALWRRLRALAGRATVVYGPGTPGRDELDRPLGDDAAPPRPCGVLEPAALERPEVLRDAVLAIAGELDADYIAEDQPDIDCSLFEDADGRARALFVGNRARDARQAIIALPPGGALTDPLGGPPPKGGRVDLAPGQTRMFVL